jgi:hypothetical protein
MDQASPGMTTHGGAGEIPRHVITQRRCGLPRP